MRLFPLKLQPRYELLGAEYEVFGTINYMLENEDGGHYITYLFPSAHEVLRVHEIEAKTMPRKPDFDTETVIVALKRVGKFVSLFPRIEAKTF